MNLASWERAKASNVKILFNEHIIGIIGGLIQKHRLKIEPSFCYNKLNRSCSCSLLFFFISFVKNYGCFVNVYNCCCCSRCRFKCTLYIHISSLHKTRRERRKKTIPYLSKANANWKSRRNDAIVVRERWQRGWFGWLNFFIFNQ